MTKSEFQQFYNFDDETMAKISVFVPTGKILSITPIVIDNKNDCAILSSKEVKK